MKCNQRILSRIFCALVLACILLPAGSVFAQNTGTILGTVKDQSGAVLPGVSITIKNVETGISRTITSGERGEYRVPALNVGTYEVRAEIQGFQTGVRQGITLTVDREAVVDFSLSVGNVTEQVTVTGEAPLIETTTSSVGGVVDQQQLKDIPLNARSFIELVPLQTGAAARARSSDSERNSASSGRATPPTAFCWMAPTSTTPPALPATPPAR